jgi:RHS repeat-associated protein
MKRQNLRNLFLPAFGGLLLLAALPLRAAPPIPQVPHGKGLGPDRTHRTKAPPVDYHKKNPSGRTTGFIFESSSSSAPSPLLSSLLHSSSVASPLLLSSAELQAESAAPSPFLLSPDAQTPEIIALAAALNHDPLKIYEWVRNNIEFRFYIYYRGGALGTYYGREGNDLDQCALLGALLQASGYTPTYTIEYIQMQLSQAANWLGVDPGSVQQAYATVGFPVTTQPSDPSFPANNLSGNVITVPRMVVNVQINGQSYVLDPSYRQYSVPIPTALDLHQTFAANPATAGSAGSRTALAGTINQALAPGEFYVGPDNAGYSTPASSVDNLRSTLGQLSVSATASLRAITPAQSGASVIGKRTATLSLITALPTQLLDGQTINPNGGPIAVGPNNFEVFSPWIFFQVDYTTLQAPLYALGGKKLSIAYDTSYNWHMFLDDVDIADQFYSTGLPYVQIYYGYEHSDGSIIDSAVTARNLGYNFVVAYRTNASLGRLHESLRRLTDNQLTNAAPVAAQTEQLNIIGLQYMNQSEFIEQVVDGASNVAIDDDYFAGLITQGVTPFVDLAVGATITYPRTPAVTAAQGQTTFNVFNYWASALERVAVDQAGNFNAYCTTSFIEYALRQGQPILLGTSADTVTDPNSGAISIEGIPIQNLDSSISPTITNAMSGANGGIVLIPENALLSLNGVSVGGFLLCDLTHGGFGSLIYGGPNGGTGTTPAPFDPLGFNPFDFTFDPSGDPIPTGGDPIDLTTGALRQKKTALALGGGGPTGLDLELHYIGSDRARNIAGLGAGWTHSYNIQALPRSPNDINANQVGIADAVPFLLATEAIFDVYGGNADTSVKDWVMPNLLVNWGSDQLISSHVLVAMADRAIDFTRQPDGSFVAPSCVTATLTQNSDQSLTFAFRNGNQIHFRAADGWFDSITDQYERSLTATYAGTPGVLSQVTDCYGRALQFNYSGSQLTSVQDSTGRTVSFLAAPGSLTFTDSENQSTVYATDSLGRITQVTDARGRTVIANNYDQWDRISSQTTLGLTDHLLTMGYSPGLTSQTDALGNISWTYFDAAWRQVGSLDPLGNFTQWSYDGADQLVQLVKPSGAKTTLVYDNNFILRSVTDPLGHTTTFTPDSLLRLQTFVDQNSNTTTYFYNGNTASVTKIVAPGDIQTHFGYDSSGNLTSYQPPSDSAPVTYANFDPFGMPQTITHPVGGSDSAVYDSRGNVLSVTDRRGVITSFDYNSRNQLRHIYSIDPASSQTFTARQIDYDAAGETQDVIEAPDAIGGSGRMVSFDHDALGQLITVKKGAAQVTVLAQVYDVRDLLATSTDGVGNASNYFYDVDQRLVSVTDPLSHTWTRSYDADGNVNGTLTPLQIVTTTEYDLAERPTAASDGLVAFTGFGYDNAGRRTSLTNRLENTYAWAYDDANRKVTITTPLLFSSVVQWSTNGLPSIVTKASGRVFNYQSYDPEGRLVDYSDGAGTKYLTYEPNGLTSHVTATTNGISLTSARTYDSLNRLVEFDDGLGNTIKYAYYLNGRLSTLTYPGGKTVSYAYDDFGRLSTVTDWASRTTTYQYDNASRLTDLRRPNGTTSHRNYDADGRIAQNVDYSAAGTVIHFENLAYDADGRMVQSFLNPANPAVSLPVDALSFDADNRLNNWNGQAVTMDNDGNTTAGPLPGGTFGAYVWDGRSRLASAGPVNYAYGPDEQLTGVDGANYAIDPNQRLSTTLVRTLGSTTTYYVYGLGLIYEDTNGAMSTYHFDHVGSTVAITAADGTTVTDRMTYSSYGTVTSRSGSTATPFLFNGSFGVMTDSAGLLYMRARFYNSRIMRFISADPLGFGGGENWYAFVGGDPINYVDPTGEVRWGALGSATLGVITNGLGVVTAGLLAVTPEPTMVTKVAAVGLGLKSSYGLGANAQNFYDALTNQDPISKGTLANDVAQAVAPGNETAQKIATVADLATDLATGRISANAAEDAVGTAVRDANGFPLYDMQYGYVQDAGNLGPLANAFTLSALAETGYNEAYKPLFTDHIHKKPCGN